MHLYNGVPRRGWTGVLDYASLPINFKFYFLLLGLVCARALPATDFAFLLKRPSLRMLLALAAAFRDVCLVFRAILMPPFQNVNLRGSLEYKDT